VKTESQASLSSGPAAANRNTSAERPRPSNNYASGAFSPSAPSGSSNTNVELYKQLDVLRTENFELK
jgi:hypothetical protein